MQAVRCITQHHQPGAHLLFGLDQTERVTVACTDALERAHAKTKRVLQRVQKGCIRQRHHVVSLRLGLGPHQRTAPGGHRQQRQRAVGGKALVGDAIMALRAGDIGDNRGLPIGAHLTMNAQLLQQARAAAVSDYQQISGLLVQLLMRLNLHQPATAGRLGAHHPGRRLPAHYRRVQCSQQHLPKRGIFDHIAKRGHPLFFGKQPGNPGMAAIGYMNLADGLCLSGQFGPYTELLKQQVTAVRQRGRARVKARLRLSAGRRLRFDQLDTPAALPGLRLQRQRQAGADHAATNNADAAAHAG